MPITRSRLLVRLMIRIEAATRLALAAGVIAQSALLWARSELTLLESAEFWVATLGIVIVIAELWRWRRHLNPHVDMLLIMFSIGGAGMAFGLPAGVFCHAAGWTEWLQMSSLMIAAGLLPSVVFSRCLLEARREKKLCSTMALDSAGMLAGMQLAGLIADSPASAWAIIANHTFMVIGMIAGMSAAMALRRTRSYSMASMTDVGV
jgi:hypothetical protein